MKNILNLFIIILSISICSTIINAQDSNTKPKLIALKFHADWCGTCKAMGPVFEDLINKLDGQPVLFYRLDFTNNSTKHQSLLMGDALDLSDIIMQNQGTGFILLIDANSKEVLEKLTKDDDIKTMANKITARL